MKLGIITFHSIPNTGATLQAYSLCKAFRDLGVDCYILNYTSSNIRKRELQCRKTGNILKDLLFKWFIWPKRRKKILAVQKFMQSKNMLSKKIYEIETLRNSNCEYDAFISGSDMLWNLTITDYDWSFFLNFVDETKNRFAYGSSIGASWAEKDIPTIQRYLSKFMAISVRESDTCIYLNSIGLKAQFVCDPTMLIRKDDWEQMAKNPKEHQYVLVYFPSKENLQAAKKYAQKHDLKVLVMNWSRTILGFKNISPQSPEEWIGYFKNADAVFTASYHGLLFSIYFNKQVWTSSTSNKANSILQKLQMESCKLSEDPNLTNVINYSKVNTIVDQFREESISYLQTIIKMANNNEHTHDIKVMRKS